MKLIKKHPLISTSIILFLCCEFYVLILEKFKLPIPSYIKNVLNSPYTILIFLIGMPIIYFSFKAAFISSKNCKDTPTSTSGGGIARNFS